MLDLLSNALYASLLISIAVAVVGTIITVQKSSFIAGSIAHASFGGIGIATFFSLPFIVVTPLFAVFLGLLLSFILHKFPHRSDSVIGVIWAIGMSVGIIFIEMTPGYNAGMMSYLFGSILTVPLEDIYLMIVIDLLLVTLSFLFYHQILLLSYDKEFAKLRGLHVLLYQSVLTVLIALTVVMSVRSVGLILIIALFTIPPFIAERFTKNLKQMMVVSGVLSFLFITGGIFLSFYEDISATASVVLIASLFFGLSLFKRA